MTRKVAAKEPDTTSPAKSAFAELFNVREGERTVQSGFKMLAPARIVTEAQVRRTIKEEEVAELRQSISELHRLGEGIEGSGLIQAVLVTPLPHDRGYRLVAGHKRHRAATELKLPEIPAVLIERTSESAIRLIQLTENEQRSPVPPLERAAAYQTLRNEMNLSIRDLARLLGKNKGSIEALLNLLRYGADVQKMVSKRSDTLLHARYIEKVTDRSLRRRLINATLRENAPLRDILRRIEESAPRAQEARAAQETAATTAVPPGSTPREAAAPAKPATADPIAQALRPAVAQAAEAVRQLKSIKMTAAHRQAARREVLLLKAQVRELEKIVGK